MKKILFPAFLLLLVVSCTTNDDPNPASCRLTVLEDFNESSTFFYFNELSNGFNALETISVDDATSSSSMYTYEYSGKQISKLTYETNNFTTVYTPAYDGDKLITLSARQLNSGIVTEEIIVKYAGSDISSLEYYVADVNTFNLYQYLHYGFSYDDGNMSVSEYYVDFAVLSSLLSGETPTEAYAPELLFLNEYGYGSQAAPNGLYGQINLFKPEMSMMKNAPATIIQKDLDGNIIGSLGYEISFNEQGFPTYLDGGSTYIDLTYNCN